MIILLDAAPSNSEMFGWFIFFGLMFLLFLIGWLFSPKGVKELAEVVVPQRGEGSSPYGCLIAVMIIGIIIMISFMNAGSVHH